MKTNGQVACMHGFLKFLVKVCLHVACHFCFFSAHFGHLQRRSPSRSGMSCKTKLRPAGVHDVLCDAQVHLFWLIPSLYVLSSTFPDIPAFVSMILIVAGGQHESN